MARAIRRSASSAVIVHSEFRSCKLDKRMVQIPTGSDATNYRALKTVPRKCRVSDTKSPFTRNRPGLSSVPCSTLAASIQAQGDQGSTRARTRPLLTGQLRALGYDGSQPELVRGSCGYPAGLEKYGERLERLPGCGALPV